MFCCALLYVHSSFAIILMGKRELVALLGLSCWCLVIVVWLFLVVPWVCQQFVIKVFPDHTHYFWHISDIVFKQTYENWTARLCMFNVLRPLSCIKAVTDI